MDKAVSPRGLRIGELARSLGTTTKTLRFYEEIGLLAPTQRSESSYRLYGSEAIATARLLIGLRHLELTIPEIQALLSAPRPAEAGRPPRGSRKVAKPHFLESEDGRTSRRQRLMALMDERLRRMELELGVLQGRCDDLSARHAALLATPRGRPPHCICDALLLPCNCAPVDAKSP